MPPRIRITRPETGDEEATEVASVLSSGFLTQGPKVLEFESQVRESVGVRHGVATSSGTSALHLALAALGIGPGDEVLVPDFTFPATANVVAHLGARPVLVDIDPTTFAIDPTDIEGRITERSRAILPVHPFGMTADMDAVLAVAERHKLLVIEDAACALGALYRGRPAGSIGVLGCFSFHPRKSITTGEGGMVVTDDETLAERLRSLRNHGAVRSDDGWHFEAAGYNYRLSDILAAVGVVQFRKLPSLIDARRKLAGSYRTLLGNVDDIQLPVDPGWGTHIYQSFVILLPNAEMRPGVMSRLAERGIETTIGTYALHAEPFFARSYGYQAGDMPRSYDVARRALSLPLYPRMTLAEQTEVAEELVRAIGQAE